MTRTVTDDQGRAAWRAEVAHARRSLRPQKLRTMRQFAEEEIVIPSGPYEGRRYRCDRQPYSGVWFDLVDSGEWIEHVAGGPSQSGKSLNGYVIPAVYHLCEIGETVILGLPDLHMASDKWHEDILPVIERTRYRDLLPRRGAGSKGGMPRAIRLQNGATLRFMSAGGDDKSRAHFTSRVLIITETDGLDEASEASREADPIAQLEARCEAYGERRRIYKECTVSIEQGHTWQKITHGTDTRLYVPCPRCGVWVVPGREHLTGWQGEDNEVMARDRAVFGCPACGEAWTDDERVAMNARIVPVHRGQEIDPAGVVHGDPPPTETLGFRWDAFNNLFWSPGHIAAREWKASHKIDEDAAEREMRQFVWALPAKDPEEDTSRVTFEGVRSRTSDELPRGMVPDGARYLTAAVDVGKWLAHWVVIAWGDTGGHIVDYGVVEIDTDRLGVERATLVALREFRELCLTGWASTAGPRRPDEIWIDSGWADSRDEVYGFCRESSAMEGASRWMPAKGYGEAQDKFHRYSAPRALSRHVREIGEDWHATWQRADNVRLIHVNADAWKSWVHTRLAMDAGQAGAVTLFQASREEHTKFAKHLTAETQVEEFIPGKGVRKTWKVERRANHWFDAVYLAAAAANRCGLRLVQVNEPAKNVTSWVQRAAEGKRRRR